MGNPEFVDIEVVEAFEAEDAHAPDRSEKIFINGEEASLDDIVKDGDIIILAKSVRGAVTIRCGTVWRIHKYDADPFPSSPHAHDRQTGMKLDLSNGELWKKGVLVGKLKEKDLLQIRSEAEAKRVKLPPCQR